MCLFGKVLGKGEFLILGEISNPYFHVHSGCQTLSFQQPFIFGFNSMGSGVILFLLFSFGLLLGFGYLAITKLGVMGSGELIRYIETIYIARSQY